MERRDLFRRWWGRVAIAGLALVILAAGLCLFDLVQHHDGTDDHAKLLEFCCVALVVPAIVLLLAWLIPRGLVTSIGGLSLVMVEIAVPSPPPRRIRLA